MKENILLQKRPGDTILEENKNVSIFDLILITNKTIRFSFTGKDILLTNKQQNGSKIQSR